MWLWMNRRSLSVYFMHRLAFLRARFLLKRAQTHSPSHYNNTMPTQPPITTPPPSSAHQTAMRVLRYRDKWVGGGLEGGGGGRKKGRSFKVPENWIGKQNNDIQSRNLPQESSMWAYTTGQIVRNRQKKPHELPGTRYIIHP